jgi:predicted transcriptional regulator
VLEAIAASRPFAIVADILKTSMEGQKKTSLSLLFSNLNQSFTLAIQFQGLISKASWILGQDYDSLLAVS